MSKVKELEFYFDFASPYAYIAALRIDQLANKYGCYVRWNPFLVGAALGVTGRTPSLETPLVDNYVLNDIHRTTREYDILVQPKKFPILGVKLSRLFCYLSSQDPKQVKAKAFAFVHLSSILSKAKISQILKS